MQNCCKSLRLLLTLNLVTWKYERLKGCFQYIIITAWHFLPYLPTQITYLGRKPITRNSFLKMAAKLQPVGGISKESICVACRL